MFTSPQMLQLVTLRNVRQPLAIGAVAVLLSTTLSCRSAPPRPPQACAGQPLLVVQNQTRGPLDIVLVQGSANRFVGSAAPGRTTFSLISLNVPEKSHFAARRPQGAFLSVHNDSVTFSRECQ